MRIDVIGQPAQATLPTPARIMDSWQVGQILQAVVVSTDVRGTMTLRINDALIQAQTQHPLPTPLPGQSLQLKVISNQTDIVLKVVNPATKDDPITQALRTALPRQTELVPLLNNITLLANPSPNKSTSAIPQPLAQLVQQLFNNLASTTQATTAAGLKEAVNNSGLFLESKLAHLATQSPNLRLPLSVDFKAGLLLLREMLTTPSPSGQQQETPTTPRSSGAEPQTLFRNTATQNVSGTSAPATTAGTPGLNTPQLLTTLATQTEGALARLQINQLVSFSAAPDNPLWTIELPLRQDHQTDLIQLRIEKDAASRTTNAQEKPWSISLKLEPAGLGAVHARLTLLGQQISVALWAEQTATATLANRNIESLQYGLTQAGFDTGTLCCQEGVPPHTTPDALLIGTHSLLDTHA